MAAPTIYKVYYTDSTNNNKLAGYLYAISRYLGFTSSKINGSISLYDFSDPTAQKKHIFMKNVEYTSDLYVVGFWFSVKYISNTSTYTLFSVLETKFTIETNTEGIILKDSTYSKMYSFDSNNVYNMIAIVIQNRQIVKIIINSDIYTLDNAKQSPISDGMGFVFGNNNTMTAGLNGYIGEIKLLNETNFNNKTFDIDTLYEKMKYKIQPPTTIPTTTTTTTRPTTTTTTTIPTTTTTVPTTTTTERTTTTTTVPTTTTTERTTTTTTTTTTIPTTTTTIPTTTTTIPTTTTTIPTTTTTIPSTTTTIPTTTTTTTVPTSTRATNVYGTNQDAGSHITVHIH